MLTRGNLKACWHLPVNVLLPDSDKVTLGDHPFIELATWAANVFISSTKKMFWL